MALSIIYRSPLLYHTVMRCLHGRHFADRYRAVAGIIPDGAEVVEVAAGDAWLYRHYLKPKKVNYLGLDNAPAFLKKAERHGVPFRNFDLLNETIPTADYVILQAALHLFHDLAPAILQRLLDAARHKVIIAEPVRNMADSSNPVISLIGKSLTRPHNQGTDHSQRFTPETFSSLMRACPEFLEIFPEPGGREHIAVLRGRASS